MCWSKESQKAIGSRVAIRMLMLRVPQQVSHIKAGELLGLNSALLPHSARPEQTCECSEFFPGAKQHDRGCNSQTANAT